jgi:hypothetical protein
MEAVLVTMLAKDVASAPVKVLVAMAHHPAAENRCHRK